MSVVFSAEIQSRPAGSRSSRMRARGEHPPVAHQRDAADAEAPADPVHLARHRGRVRGVAGEDLHGDGTPVGGAEQPEHDLPLAPLAVAVVAEGRERALRAFQVAGADVVQDERAALQVPVGEAPLDPGLALQQPVEHVQHLVAGDGPEPEQGPEARRGGLRIQRPGRRELRGRADDPRGDGGEREVPHAFRLPAEDPRHAERAHRAQHGGHVAVGKGAADGEGLPGVVEDDPAPEDGAEPVDDGGIERREVGDGLVADAPPLAPGPPEEDGPGAVLVGDDVDSDGHPAYVSCFLPVIPRIRQENGNVNGLLM